MADPSETEDTSTPLYTVLVNVELEDQKDLGPQMAELLTWLGRYLKVVITDGRRLVGKFLQTDADVNIVLGDCSEYLVADGHRIPKFLGTVKVPCEHIVCMRLHGRPGPGPGPADLSSDLKLFEESLQQQSSLIRTMQPPLHRRD